MQKCSFFKVYFFKKKTPSLIVTKRKTQIEHLSDWMKGLNLVRELNTMTGKIYEKIAAGNAILPPLPYQANEVRESQIKFPRQQMRLPKFFKFI